MLTVGTEVVSAGWLQLRQADGSPGVTVGREGDVRCSEQPLLDEELFQARQTPRAGLRRDHGGTVPTEIACCRRARNGWLR